MTANHAHTPLDDLVLRMHIHFGAANTMGDDYSADDFADVIRILENMPAIEAAAEQRGSARALREAADDLFYDGDTDRPLPGYDDLYNRADQMEGDDA